MPFVEPNAAHSDHYMRIPEPMIFDLMRPLGARRGEMEMNALADVNARSGDVSWAPELEYAFDDGFAFEIELPFESTALSKYKFGLQKTLETDLKRGMINGWQSILYKDHGSKYISADVTYIHALRWNERWSSVSLLGLRMHHLNAHTRTDHLLNHSVFYDVSTRLTLGLELNHEVQSGGRWRYRVTPQMHYDLNQLYTAQLGWALSNLDGSKKEASIFSMRLIRVF